MFKTLLYIYPTRFSGTHSTLYRILSCGIHKYSHLWYPSTFTKKDPSGSTYGFHYSNNICYRSYPTIFGPSFGTI